MENTELTVPSHFIKTMLSIAAERDCDTEQLITNIGINPQDIADEKPISVLQYGELHHHIPPPAKH